MDRIEPSLFIRIEQLLKGEKDDESEGDAEHGIFLDTVDLPSDSQSSSPSSFVTPPLKGPKWINTLTVENWIQACDQYHGVHCQPPISHRITPYWLIDAVEACLVRAPPSTPYAALSYVWGTTASGQACKKNLEKFQRPGSLLQDTMPSSICDVIRLLPQLGERYLWVDRLCIVQDDDRDKEKHINNMATIYSNARMTIVIAIGDNADHGLRGIKGMTPPLTRDHGVTNLQRTAHQLTRIATIPSTKWYSRGWTLQEIVFSRRALYFTERGAFWECHCHTWSEDTLDFHLVSQNTRCNKIVADIFRDSYFPRWPNLHMYLQLVSTYNSRQLTFDDDALAAFAGVTTALSDTFYGGCLF